MRIILPDLLFQKLNISNTNIVIVTVIIIIIIINIIIIIIIITLLIVMFTKLFYTDYTTEDTMGKNVAQME
jgi:hypothetical protein